MSSAQTGGNSLASSLLVSRTVFNWMYSAKHASDMERSGMELAHCGVKHASQRAVRRQGVEIEATIFLKMVAFYYGKNILHLIY